MGTAFKKLTVSAIKRCTDAGLRVLTAGTVAAAHSSHTRLE
jgi:hypothetical protein